MIKKVKIKISVFGLGKLGCSMLACFASKGWQVIGVDINKEFVNKVNAGISPIYEPGVEKLIKENRKRIEATINPKFAVDNSDISFIIVPTPSIENGSFTTKFVEAIVAEIGSILHTKKDYHTVVVTSTVLLGDMEKIVNLLEKTSGKEKCKDFSVCYNPDFIALGSVVRDFLNPEIVLIGESDEKAGAILENIHRNLVENNPNIHRMNFYNAELTKIALNSYCTLKITFANELAKICEKMPGGDIDKVTNALGDDERIGRKYLKGGLSFGGPCFPRDNRAIAYSAKRFGYDLRQALLTDELNNYHRNLRIPTVILSILKEKKSNRLSVLGLTYKSDTPIVEESASICIINALVKEGVYINVYDPAGLEEAKKELSDTENIKFKKSAIECIRGTDVCFIATPWNEFKKISKEDFIKAMRTPTIFDAWNIYCFSKEDGIDYRKIGMGL